MLNDESKRLFRVLGLVLAGSCFTYLFFSSSNTEQQAIPEQRVDLEVQESRKQSDAERSNIIEGRVTSNDDTHTSPSFLASNGQKETFILAEKYITQDLSQQLQATKSVVKAHSASSDSAGNTHVRLSQAINGVSVYGGNVIAHLNPDGELFHITNGLQGEHVVSDHVKPLLSGERAVEIIHKNLFNESVPTLQDVELVFFNNESSNTLELTWKVDLKPYLAKHGVSAPTLILSATNGDILLRSEQIHSWRELDSFATGATWTRTNQVLTMRATGRGPYRRYFSSPKSPIEIRDCRGQGLSNCADGLPSQVQSKTISTQRTHPGSSGDSTEQQAVDALFAAERFGEYMEHKLGGNLFKATSSQNNSWLRCSGPQPASGDCLIININTGAVCQGFYAYGQIFLGGGDNQDCRPMTALDIVTHELGHFITRHPEYSQLMLQSNSLSGWIPLGISEHLSDVYALASEAYVSGHADFTIGEDSYHSAHGPSRSFAEPRIAHVDNLLEACGNLLEFPYCKAHWIGEVANHAFYLLTHPGASHSTTGIKLKRTIPLHKAARIWHEANKHYLVSSADYGDLRIATMSAAIILYGLDYAGAVSAAWAAVGVR